MCMGWTMAGEGSPGWHCRQRGELLGSFVEGVICNIVTTESVLSHKYMLRRKTSYNHPTFINRFFFCSFGFDPQVKLLYNL